MEKWLTIKKADVLTYQQLLHIKEIGIPNAFLLTLWQYFDVPELKQQDYLLATQKVRVYQELQVDQAYLVALNRIKIVTKKTAAFWTYRLTISKEARIYAQCDTKIYVRTAY